MGNQVVLITGGTRGFGRAAALAFARKRASVVFTGRDDAAAAITVRLLAELDVEVRYVHADVKDSKSMVDVVKRAVDEFGRIDAAFNNAGVAGDGKFLELSEESWSNCVETNLSGVWRSMCAEASVMIAQGYGCIVNNASIWGVLGRPGFAAYSAAKHGVIGLTRSAALEFAGRHLRINAVCPGTADTDMIRQLGRDDGALQRLAAEYPLGRLVRADDVANAVVWLCSAESAFVTGQCLFVDGGYTAQ